MRVFSLLFLVTVALFQVSNVFSKPMPLPKDQSAMWNHSVSTNMLPSKEKPKSRCGNTDISCLLDLDQIATRKKPGDLGRKQRLQNQQFALAKAPNPRTSLCNLKSNVCRYSNNNHLSGTRKSIKLTTRTKPKIATISAQRKTNRRPKCKPTGAANGACAVKTWWLDLSPDDLDSGNELVGMSATSTPKSSAAQKILVSFPKQRCKGNKCKPKVEYKWFNLDLGNEFGPTKAQTRKPLLRQEQAQDSPAMSISSGFDEDNDRVVEITSRNSEPALARVSRLVRVPRLHSSIDSGLYSTTALAKRFVSGGQAAKREVETVVTSQLAFNRPPVKPTQVTLKRAPGQCALNDYQCHFRLIPGKKDDIAVYV